MENGNVKYADASKLHPEIQIRHNEIVQVMKEMSDEETIDALWSFAQRKWQLLRSDNEQPTPDGK